MLSYSPTNCLAEIHRDSLSPAVQTQISALGSWPARILVIAFLACTGYSVYLALTLLASRCEGFSCTYLGVAWVFWLGVSFLPAAVLGYFAQGIKSLPRGSRSALRIAWLLHFLFAAGLIVWWLIHRFWR